MPSVNVSEWTNVKIDDARLARIRAEIEAALREAGFKGEFKRVSTRNLLKGEVAAPADAFRAGNVAPEGDEDVALAKAWAEAIAAGRGSLDDIKAWPDLHKRVATMLTRKAAPPAPPAAKAPPAPPAPAGKIGAEHGVTVTRRGKRAAAA